jgi:hypothetical protein
MPTQDMPRSAAASAPPLGSSGGSGAAMPDAAAQRGKRGKARRNARAGAPQRARRMRAGGCALEWRYDVSKVCAVHLFGNRGLATRISERRHCIHAHWRVQ